MSPNPSTEPGTSSSPMSDPASPASVPTSSLFLQPTPSSPPSSSSTTGPTSPSRPGDAVTGDWSSAAAGSESTATYGSGATPSTGDPGPAGPSPTSKAGIRAVVRQAVKTVTGLAAGFLVLDEEEKEEGLWRADEDDLTDISNPASRLIYRRLPDDAKSGSDPIDLLQLAVAVAGYVGKNLQRRGFLRQSKQQDTVEESPA
jgi:hypothetical protein